MPTTRPLPHRVAQLSVLCAALLGCQAQAAITCSLSATAINVIFTQTVASDANGAITLSCNRATGDPSTQAYWIGVSPVPGNPRRLFRHGGGTTNPDRLNANLYKAATTTDWGDSNSGTSRVSGTLNFGAATSASTTLPYRFYIPANTGNNAGIFDVALVAQLQLATAGAVVATADFAPTASILTQCFVGNVVSGNTAPGTTSPSTIALNYASFSATAQTANMSFTVDCTNSTPYSLALSPASGTLLGLNYNVNFSSGGPTVTSLTGTGLAQSYTVVATVPANQAGTCNAATCAASQAHTVTITY